MFVFFAHANLVLAQSPRTQVTTLSIRRPSMRQWNVSNSSYVPWLKKETCPKDCHHGRAFSEPPRTTLRGICAPSLKLSRGPSAHAFAPPAPAAHTGAAFFAEGHASCGEGPVTCMIPLRWAKGTRLIQTPSISQPAFAECVTHSCNKYLRATSLLSLCNAIRATNTFGHSPHAPLS